MIKFLTRLWRKKPTPEPVYGYRSLEEAFAAKRRGEIAILVYEKGTLV